MGQNTKADIVWYDQPAGLTAGQLANDSSIRVAVAAGFGQSVQTRTA